MKSQFNVLLMILFLISGISVCQGQLKTGESSLEFNVRKVPFSSNKSFMSVCENRKSKCLALTDLRFALFGRDNEIFRFYYLTDSDTIMAEATGTPGLMSLSAWGKASGQACFESKKIFRLKGKDIPLILKLDEQLIQKDIVNVVSNEENKFYLKNRNRFGTSFHILTCHAGTLRYNKDKGLFGLHHSAGNAYEISVEESDSLWNSTGIKKSFDDCVKTDQQNFDEFLMKMPALPENYKKSRELASYILWSSVVDKGGNYKRPGMLMSKNWMHYIWSWDHCFNAIACSYNLPGMAWDNFMTVFDAQDAEGRLPDVLGYARLDTRVLKAPIHGWTLNKMQKEMKLTNQQLNEAYITLKRWTNYWFNHRDSNNNGIPEYLQANDCWDNGSEFNINGDPNYIANRESATLSAYLITQMDELQELALKLGNNEDAVEWKKKSAHLFKHMLEKLWDGNRFLTINLEDGSFNKESRSLMRFVPFFLGNKLPSEIIVKMKEDLTGGGYLTEWGLATESIYSPLYRDDGYWLGPIWAPATLIIADGLKRAGEDKLSGEIAQKFCDLCVKSGFAENFDAKTGEGLRDQAYTWTASVFLILGYEYLN